MRSLTPLLGLTSAAGLFFLTACNGSNQTASPSPAASTSANTTMATPNGGMSTDHHDLNKGGQVIETGAYHLEFVPEKTADAVHLDFYLLKGANHDPVPNAKVTAQVQRPDGRQQSLNLKYDPGDQHYTGILPGAAIGDYTVVILSDINGEKVNARYKFKP